MKYFLSASLCLLCALLFVRAEVQPGDDFNAHTTTAASTLQQWYNRRGLWDTTGWWNAANCVEALENAIVAENGGPYLKVLDRTFRQNSRTNFLNEYYDDEGWWALAWIRAFDLTGDTRYLKMSKTIFADMAASWDSHCDGGIWWRKDKHYKNAIANELFLLVAIRLHERTPGDAGPKSYFDWATREWAWFKKSGMINAQNLVNDGLNRSCENNRQTTWTYNQGVLVGGLTEFYKSTGDTNYLREAVAIADAAIATLNDGKGILAERCEPNACGGADVPQFKGIFARHLADLYDVTRKPAYYQFLLANAHSIWTNDRDGSNRFGLRWNGPVDSVDAARQSSAMMPISALAEPVTTNVLFAKGSGNPAFNHEVGAASGTLAWTCAPANTTHSGFMQTGPYVASLSKGTHTVYFRFSVDATNSAAMSLVRLDIRDSKKGTVLASRDVAWHEFFAPGESQAFGLIFTNDTAGGDLEFRVFWNNISHAPALTLIDTVVDAAHTWAVANLWHEIGQLDGMNAWCGDPARSHASGVLARGVNTREISAGWHSALFELKVDNFNWDNSKVATVSVVDIETGKICAMLDVVRSDFSTTLYQSVALKFKAEAGHRYDFQTFWHYAPHAPRLTQRSVIVK
jgi:predicted alpha-1,6-mannanase (GH76 family)